MTYPDSFDGLSKPTPSTIRAASVGISPANTVSAIIQSMQNIEYRLGLAPSATTFTANSGTDTLTANSHGLTNADVVVLKTTGALPGGLAEDTSYFVVGATTNTFQLAATRGGSAIDLTSTGSGTNSFVFLFSEGKLLVSASGSTRSQWSNAIDLSAGSLVMPQGTAPLPTAEGSIAWDTDDNLLKIGTGAATKTFVDTDSTQTLAAKTLTAPTIADFTNANHDHGDADDGGTLPASAMPNLSLSTQALSNPYKFSVYRNSAFNVTGSFAKVQFDAEFFDTNNNFDSSTDYRYTAPVAGFYFFSWMIGIPITNTDAVAAIYKNGTIFAWGNETTDGGAGGSKLIQASANDYFEIFVVASGTLAAGVGSAPVKTYFDGYLVSHT